MKRGGFLASIAAFAALPLAGLRDVWNPTPHTTGRFYAIDDSRLYDFVGGYKGVEKIRFVFIDAQGSIIPVGWRKRALWNHELHGSRLGYSAMATVRPPAGAVRVHMIRYGARKQTVHTEYFDVMPPFGSNKTIS